MYLLDVCCIEHFTHMCSFFEWCKCRNVGGIYIMLEGLVAGKVDILVVRLKG